MSLHACTPLVLPDGAGTARRFEDPRQHLPGRAPLEARDYAGFDTHALFHDVFITPDGEAIEAIGPPLVNLARTLLPLTATLGNGCGLRHRQRRHDRVTVHRFTPVHGRLPARGPIETTLRFADGYAVTMTVHRSELAPVRVQFTTLQKDNPPEWILDWLHWLALIGVDRVLLYDNGSVNRDAVLERLAQVELPLPLVWIDWPWPYGPIRSYYNQFAQATQNNHAHRCLGRAEWTGHFDIDEFPVGRPAGALDLHGLLDRAPRRAGTLRLDSCWVPDLREAAVDRLPRVTDFPYRERVPRGRAHKYLVRNRALHAANTHNARLRPGWYRHAVAPDRAMFLHYKPLTTQWRDYAVRGAAEPYDAALHVEERTVVDALAPAVSSRP